MWRGKLTLRRRRCCSPSGFLTMFLHRRHQRRVLGRRCRSTSRVHDTYWVVAHIHYVLFGGSVFAIFAGIYYWFPKMTGRMLDEGLGKIQFVLHVHRLQPDLLPDAPCWAWPGMPRRIADYAANAGWSELNLAATIGGFIIALRHAAVPLERLRLAPRTGRSPATTRGRPTRSSGRPPRRRRPTTSTTCPRSAPSARSSTPGTAGRPRTEGDDDDCRRHRPHRPRGRPRRRARRRRARHRGDRQPGPRDAPVHRLRGDVLRRPVRGVLQHPGRLHRDRGRGPDPRLAADRLRGAAQPVHAGHATGSST